MKRFCISMSITLYAESEADALDNAGAALQYYNSVTRQFEIQGVGCPRGWVVIEAPSTEPTPAAAGLADLSTETVSGPPPKENV